MQVHNLHSWQVTTHEAIDIQRTLAAQVSTKSEIASPRLVAGVDISSPDADGIASGAVFVVSYPELTQVEVQVAQWKVDFPYVPGLLSFREAPLILAAFQQLSSTPNLILVDGQGIAHPRRLGLACHLGLFLNIPTIGCAKSRLFGKHTPVTKIKGSFAELRDGNEIIGAALCTKNGTNPIYVSIGHKVDLPCAIDWALRCCNGYKNPEPLRKAHLAAGEKLRDLS